MKKFVPALLVAVMALSMATSVSADNGKNRGKGEGLWRNESNKQRHYDRTSLKGWFQGRGLGLERMFGDCGVDARTELGEASRAAFQKFMTAKNDAKEDRDDAIEAAGGDQSKIASAWKEFQSDYLAALKTYQEETMAAMTEYRSDFTKCDVVLTNPKPSPTSTTLPTYSLATVQTHDDDDDCWAAIDGKVYNFTSYIDAHQDDSADLQDICGTDASDEYDNIDDSDKPNALKPYTIGTLQ